MQRTRIVLAEMPRMLCDIIKDTVRQQPDMEVVGEEPARAAVASVVDATSADVVVIGLSDPQLPEDCSGLFTSFPGIRVLGVEGDGRRSFLWELRPQRISLGEVSPEQFVAVIRAAVRWSDKPEAM